MKIKWMPGITVPFFKIFYCRCLNCCAHIQPLLRVSVPATCSITLGFSTHLLGVATIFTGICYSWVFCPMKRFSMTLLFKEVFTSEKLAPVDFFLHIWNIIWMCYIMKKEIRWPAFDLLNFFLGQKSDMKTEPWTNVSLDNCCLGKIIPGPIVATHIYFDQTEFLYPIDAFNIFIFTQ